MDSIIEYVDYSENVDQIDEVNNGVQIEPLLDENNGQFTMFPIRYPILWKMYKAQQDSYWRAEEIDFSRDADDFLSLSEDEQYFIKMVLAFFASSDGIVNFNLRERFIK